MSEDEDYEYSSQTVKKVMEEHNLEDAKQLVDEAKHHDTNEDKFLNQEELSDAAEAITSGNTTEEDEADAEEMEQYMSQDDTAGEAETLGDLLAAAGEESED